MLLAAGTTQVEGEELREHVSNSLESSIRGLSQWPGSSAAGISCESRITSSDWIPYSETYRWDESNLAVSRVNKIGKRVGNYLALASYLHRASI